MLALAHDEDEDEDELPRLRLIGVWPVRIDANEDLTADDALADDDLGAVLTMLCSNCRLLWRRRSASALAALGAGAD